MSTAIIILWAPRFMYSVVRCQLNISIYNTAFISAIPESRSSIYWMYVTERYKTWNIMYQTKGYVTWGSLGLICHGNQPANTNMSHYLTTLKKTKKGNPSMNLKIEIYLDMITATATKKKNKSTEHQKESIYLLLGGMNFFSSFSSVTYWACTPTYTK